MWKKGKTKIIQNSIVTYKHAHTQTHTHTETLSPEYYAMSISLAPPYQARTVRAQHSLSLVRERCNTRAQASVQERSETEPNTRTNTHTHAHRAHRAIA